VRQDWNRLKRHVLAAFKVCYLNFATALSNLLTLGDVLVKGLLVNRLQRYVHGCGERKLGIQGSPACGSSSEDGIFWCLEYALSRNGNDCTKIREELAAGTLRSTRIGISVGLRRADATCIDHATTSNIILIRS
jgi:hypothetical protein